MTFDWLRRFCPEILAQYPRERQTVRCQSDVQEYLTAIPVTRTAAGTK